MSASDHLRIRVATVEDAPRLLPLFEAFYGPYFEPKTVQAIRSQMAEASAVDTILIAEADGSAVGFASLRLVPQVESPLPFAELSDLYVREDHRRRGIGRALVDTAVRMAKDRGCARVQLVAGTENDGARAFYRSLGFAEFAVAMAKRVEGPS